MAAAQRAADRAGPGAARRGRDHLREPAQRHQRRRRDLPEVGQRRRSCAGSATALRSNLAIAEVLRDGRDQGRASRRRGAARRRRPPRGGGRAHAAHRRRRLPDPPRWPVAHPEHPRPRHRARGHRRRRQLPRLRRRVGRPRPGARHRRERQDAAGRACATRPSRSSCTRRWPTRSCPACAKRSPSRASSSSATRAPVRAGPAMGVATDDDFAARVPRAEAERGGRRRRSTPPSSHVNRFGSGHTEAILTRDLAAARAVHRRRSTRPPWS